MFHHIAFDSLYISTRNDITSYFGSAANHINKCVHLGSCSSCNFWIMFQPILKRFPVWNSSASFSAVLLDIFAPWPRKWGSSGPVVIYALQRRLISNFSKTTEPSGNSQIYFKVVAEVFFIHTGNDVIICFWLAPNCVDIDAAIANFTITKFGKQFIGNY